jgi:DNA-binding protein YbaB
MAIEDTKLSALLDRANLLVAHLNEAVESLPEEVSGEDASSIFRVTLNSYGQVAAVTIRADWLAHIRLAELETVLLSAQSNAMDKYRHAVQQAVDSVRATGPESALESGSGAQDALEEVPPLPGGSAVVEYAEHILALASSEPETPSREPSAEESVNLGRRIVPIELIFENGLIAGVRINEAYALNQSAMTVNRSLADQVAAVHAENVKLAADSPIDSTDIARGIGLLKGLTNELSMDSKGTGGASW